MAQNQGSSGSGNSSKRDDDKVRDIKGSSKSDPKHDNKSDAKSDTKGDTKSAAKGERDESRGGKQSGADSADSNRGFAGMDSDKQREIAAEGGRAAHASGNAHEFTPEEAREAGSKSHGGQIGQSDQSDQGRGGNQGTQAGKGGSGKGTQGGTNRGSR